MPAHSIYSQDKHATGGFCKLPCFLFSFETALSPVINGREASITVQTPADHLLVSVGNSSHLHPTQRISTMTLCNFRIWNVEALFRLHGLGAGCIGFGCFP
jgi:hypothetical protein